MGMIPNPSRPRPCHPSFPSFDEEAEDAGGISVEAGYNKGPYNVKIKYERDEGEEDAGTFSPYGPAPIPPHMRDEDAGGISVEAGYNKGPYNVKMKYERDEGEEDAGTFAPWQRSNPNRPPFQLPPFR